MEVAKCKFDLLCTNAACHRKHSTPHGGSPAGREAVVMCKFDMSCTAVACHRKHSTADGKSPGAGERRNVSTREAKCKFDLLCSKAECYGRHSTGDGRSPAAVVVVAPVEVVTTEKARSAPKCKFDLLCNKAECYGKHSTGDGRSPAAAAVVELTLSLPLSVHSIAIERKQEIKKSFGFSIEATNGGVVPICSIRLRTGKMIRLQRSRALEESDAHCILMNEDILSAVPRGEIHELHLQEEGTWTKANAEDQLRRIVDDAFRASKEAPSCTALAMPVPTWGFLTSLLSFSQVARVVVEASATNLEKQKKLTTVVLACSTPSVSMRVVLSLLEFAKRPQRYSALGNFPTAKAPAYCWMWEKPKVGGTVFVPFDSTEQVSIEAAFVTGKSRGTFRLTRGNFAYVLDFDKMTQTNLESGTSRQLKRQANKEEDVDVEVAATTTSFVWHEMSHNVLITGPPSVGEQDVEAKLVEFCRPFSKTIAFRDPSAKLPLEQLVPAIFGVEVASRVPGETVELLGSDHLVKVCKMELLELWSELAVQVVKHDIPPHWRCDASLATGTLVDVTAEFKAKVQALIDKTCVVAFLGQGKDCKVPGTHKRLCVEQVLRVENPLCWRAYQVMKDRVASAGKHKSVSTLCDSMLEGTDLDATLNEKYLFHGAQYAVIEQIVKGGLNEKFGDLKGLLGAAIYLAENSSKADQYCMPKVGDKIFSMFLVRALLGTPFETPKAHHDMLQPPALPHDPTQRYNSVVAVTRSTHSNAVLPVYREVGIYACAQAYPEFLIHYTRK